MWKRAEEDTCPRCLGDVPDALNKGKYPGALSRVAEVEICSNCGLDEALKDFRGDKPVKAENWPITEKE